MKKYQPGENMQVLFVCPKCGRQLAWALPAAEMQCPKGAQVRHVALAQFILRMDLKERALQLLRKASCVSGGQSVEARHGREAVIEAARLHIASARAQEPGIYHVVPLTVMNAVVGADAEQTARL